MWALLSTRLRTWLLFAIAVPLAGALARIIARQLEKRHGSTRLSRGLFSVGNLASRRGRSGSERDTAASGAKAQRS
jgi:hypothetical protein